MKFTTLASLIVLSASITAYGMENIVFVPRTDTLTHCSTANTIANFIFDELPKDDEHAMIMQDIYDKKIFFADTMNLPRLHNEDDMILKMNHLTTSCAVLYGLLLHTKEFRHFVFCSPASLDLTFRKGEKVLVTLRGLLIKAALSAEPVKQLEEYGIETVDHAFTQPKKIVSTIEGNSALYRALAPFRSMHPDINEEMPGLMDDLIWEMRKK